MATSKNLSLPFRARVRPGATARPALRPGLAGALGYVLALLVASIGLAWDIQWHVWVGRDSFWSPPHLLLYAGVTVAGALAFGQVAGAWWLRARPARGYQIGAAGLLLTLLAAPFDELWHRIYGIDVDLWAPAHLLGLIGGSVAGVGAVALWAELRGAAPRRPWGGLTWGLVLAASGLLALLLTIAQPALTRYPTTHLGGLVVLTLPVLQAAAVAGVLVAMQRLLGRPGAALATVGLLWARQALLAVLVPWLIQVVVAAEGLSYRVDTSAPPVSPMGLLGMGLLVPAALAVEAAWRWGRRWPLGGWAGLAGLLVAGMQLATAPVALALAGRSVAPIAAVAPEIVGRAGWSLTPAVWLAAVPAALAAGLLAGWLGTRCVKRET